LESLASLCKGKVGLIFSDKAVSEVRPIVEQNKVPQAARVGAISPIDVVIPPGPTGMDPSQITFFHALSISTKIQKSQIEITKEFRVCTKGKKVGNSEAVLLQKLNLKPFEYGMEVKFVYDNGNILAPEIFRMSTDDLLGKVRKGVSNLACISLAIGDVNEVSVPHMILNGFKNIASISLEVDIKLKQLGAIASAPAKSAPAQGKTDAPKVEAPKAPEKKEEVVEEVAIGGMFGDDF